MRATRTELPNLHGFMSYGNLIYYLKTASAAAAAAAATKASAADQFSALSDGHSTCLYCRGVAI